MDGLVDGTDYLAMRSAVLKFRQKPSQLVPRGDINQDGRVDVVDMRIYFMPAWQELMSTGGNGREQLSYSAGGVPDEWRWHAGNDAYHQRHLDNRLGFAGYVWDPWLKVYHVRHRVYDPFDTRWLQADPIGYAGGDTDLRRYCNGDPVNFVDPLGLWGTQDPAPPDGGGAWNSGPMIPSWIHTTLDVIGFFPGVGTVADVANGGLYAIDGEWDEAGLSLVGAIPAVGDAIAGTRKGIKAVDKIDDAVDAAKGAEGAKGVDNAEDAASKAGNPKKPDDGGKPAGGAEGGSGCGNNGDPSASTPVGRRGEPINATGSNVETTINGRTYGNHAIDQMQGRGIPPSAVEEAISNGVKSPDPIAGRVRHHDPINDITVVTENGKVITVIPGER
jgi:RHS repeat-associated protein